jgi:MoaA/NifB/PqqE/SkfB family radical SAM enzyme
MTERNPFIHIEPTSRCTLACPQCQRTIEIDNVTVADCDIETMVRSCEGARQITMCGNHGDPIYHPKYHELLFALRDAHPKARFLIHTNGAFRNELWWTKTALLLRKEDGIIFSIDGLPENNHIYRVNSRWPDIEAAVKTVRAHNKDVTLVWKWIRFDYNQHQVATGVAMAKQLGFNYFNLVESERDVKYDPHRPTIPFDDSWSHINDYSTSSL